MREDTDVAKARDLLRGATTPAALLREVPR